MALRTVRVMGDPVLTKVCKEVREVNARTRDLIQDMLDTMYEANGVGLAAPQVGILKRIVVWMSPVKILISLSIRSFWSHPGNRPGPRDVCRFPVRPEQ